MQFALRFNHQIISSALKTNEKTAKAKTNPNPENQIREKQETRFH